MIIPLFDVPSRFVGTILIDDLFTRHVEGDRLEKFPAQIGHKVRWSFEWARDNPKDVVIAEAANILMDRKQ